MSGTNGTPANAPTPGTGPTPGHVDLTNFLRRHGPSLVDFRRDLHRHPEPSYAEHATTDKICNWLRANGLDPKVLSRGTGVVCDIGESDGPVVALRADIDALAMDDMTDSEYTSRRPGVAHACGHDVHTSVVLGAGIALHTLDEMGRLPGRVRLIFEPGEETVPGGAIDVIKEGFLEDVAVIFGLHCDPKAEVGYVGGRVGPITSASDTVEITLRGPGGHTARPERTVNLVQVAGLVVTELPGRFAELAASVGATRLVFGALHTGEAPNVIPGLARMRGTMRTPSRELWDAAPQILRAALADVIGATGATWDVDYGRGIPPVVNDADAMATMEAAARASLGDEAVFATEQSWGGDSFAWYLEEVPGAYGRLGTHNPQWVGPRLDLHASTFDVDERAIGVGVSVMVNSALLWQAGHAN
ncbi:MAG: amidohydrolase [Actinobacteria bacterium]|nr:amidohydrolase [Actinomycetota bacterium]